MEHDDQLFHNLFMNEIRKIQEKNVDDYDDKIISKKDYIQTNDDLDKFVENIEEELIVQNGGRKKNKSFSKKINKKKSTIKGGGSNKVISKRVIKSSILCLLGVLGVYITLHSMLGTKKNVLELIQSYGEEIYDKFYDYMTLYEACNFDEILASNFASATIGFSSQSPECEMMVRLSNYIRLLFRLDPASLAKLSSYFHTTTSVLSWTGNLLSKISAPLELDGFVDIIYYSIHKDQKKFDEIEVPQIKLSIPPEMKKSDLKDLNILDTIQEDHAKNEKEKKSKIKQNVKSKTEKKINEKKDNIKPKKCENGTRRNKKTGLCEKK
jgi:hypothetical protein